MARNGAKCHEMAENDQEMMRKSPDMMSISPEMVRNSPEKIQNRCEMLDDPFHTKIFKTERHSKMPLTSI